MIIRVRPTLFVEMTLEEAEKFIGQQEVIYNKKIEMQTQSINQIKAHIAFVFFEFVKKK